MKFILLWTLFIWTNVAIHWYMIEKQNKTPNHPLWTLIRATVLITLSFGLGGDYRSNLLGGGMMFQFLFYVPLNLCRGEQPWYLSDHGLDALFKKGFPSQVWFFFFLLICGGGIGVVIQGWPF